MWNDLFRRPCGLPALSGPAIILCPIKKLVKDISVDNCGYLSFIFLSMSYIANSIDTGQ